MLSLKSDIGKSSGSFQDEVTSQRLAAFWQAVGAPVSEKAPPTFLTVFRQGEFALFNKLGVDLSQVLHAEQEYVYETPILAGDVIHFETSLTQVLEKQGSTSFMQFLTFETEFQAERKANSLKIGKLKTLIVIRGEK